MNPKICTTIEQSKKLIELGLDVNTADMCWCNEDDVITVPYNNSHNMFKYCPAWSLSSLENFIPCGIKSDDNLTYLFNKWKRLDDWKCAYHINDNEYISFSGNNFDVIYEMVCWLLDNKKI